MAKHKLDDYEAAEMMMRGARVVQGGRELTDLSKDELLHKQQFESGLRLFGPTDAARKAKAMVDLRNEFEAAFGGQPTMDDWRTVKIDIPPLRWLYELYKDERMRPVIDTVVGRDTPTLQHIAELYTALEETAFKPYLESIQRKMVKHYGRDVIVKDFGDFMHEEPVARSRLVSGSSGGARDRR